MLLELLTLTFAILKEELFDQNVTLRRDLMSQPGVVPNIMEALEMKKMDVLHAVLRVINIVSSGAKLCIRCQSSSFLVCVCIFCIV